MTRILITGGPRTGKTTLAEKMFEAHDWHHAEPDCDGCGQLRHTDDLIAQCAGLGKDGWSEASRLASEWLDAPGPWIIEGVAVCRALRKWREAHPGESPPVDKVIRLTTPHVALTKGQATMAKGEETVWQEIAGWLYAAGVARAEPAELRFEHPGHNGTAKL